LPDLYAATVRNDNRTAQRHGCEPSITTIPARTIDRARR
jgi:hypothetical protein